MSEFFTMPQEDLFFFCCLGIVFLGVLIYFLIHQIDHWSFTKAMKQWAEENPVAASMYDAIEKEARRYHDDNKKIAA